MVIVHQLCYLFFLYYLLNSISYWYFKYIPFSISLQAFFTTAQVQTIFSLARLRLFFHYLWTYPRFFVYIWFLLPGFYKKCPFSPFAYELSFLDSLTRLRICIFLFDLELLLYIILGKVQVYILLCLTQRWQNGISSFMQALLFTLLWREKENIIYCIVFISSAANNFFFFFLPFFPWYL